jgi:predicted trehalose synthase
MYESGSPSTGTVAMNFSAVDNAGGALVTHAGAIGQALQGLDTALGPVRETWYASGSQSGMDAQTAEMNLRKLLGEMAQIINNLGSLLSRSAGEAAALDGALGQRFQENTSMQAMNTGY